MAKRGSFFAKLTSELKEESGLIDPYSKSSEKYIIRSLSPSVNFTFGWRQGFPAGSSLLLWGPPKAGKTLLANAIVAQLHRDDPEACVLKFDTEYRSRDQMDSLDEKAAWGIDPERYQVIENSNPEMVFNTITNELTKVIESGFKVKLVIIDSITGIQGVNGAERQDVTNQQRGDEALTIQKGLKQILPFQKKLGFGLILTAHARAEQDANRAKYVPIRPAAAWGTKHHCEFFAMVQANKSKTGKTDELDNAFVDNTVKDLWDEGERTGHKIRFTLEEASFGPNGRSGEFTVDYRRGLINTHEEIFRLGVNWKIIEKPNNKTYEFGGRSWVGKPAMLEAIKNDGVLAEAILEELRRRDKNGTVQVAERSVESEETSAE